MPFGKIESGLNLVLQAQSKDTNLATREVILVSLGVESAHPWKDNSLTNRLVLELARPSNGRIAGMRAGAGPEAET
jgi:hypothetical protein